MNILQKIVYYFLEKQEKALTKRLSRHLRTSSSNSTSKTVVSKGVTMTLNAETERNKDLVLKNVSDIIKGCNSDISKLLAFIESKGTKVIRLENADKILSVIKEEEGLITPLEGIEALRNFLISIGMPKNFAELGAKEEDIEKLAHTCCYGDVNTGTVEGFATLDQKDVENIYKLMVF